MGVEDQQGSFDDSQIEEEVQADEGDQLEAGAEEAKPADTAAFNDLTFETEDGELITVPGTARVRFKHNKREVDVPAGEFLGYGQIGFDGQSKKAELAAMKREYEQKLAALKSNPEAFGAISEFYSWGRQPQNRAAAQMIDLIYTGEIDPARVAAAAKLLRQQEQQGAAPKPTPKAEADWMSGETEETAEDGSAEATAAASAAPPAWFQQFATHQQQELAAIKQRLEAGDAQAKAQRERRVQEDAKTRAQQWNDLALRTAGASSLVKQAYRGRKAKDVLEKLHEIRSKGEADPTKAVRILEAELKGYRDAFIDSDVNAAAEVNDAFRPGVRRTAGAAPRTPTPTPPREEPQKLTLKPNILGEQSRAIGTRMLRGLFDNT